MDSSNMSDKLIFTVTVLFILSVITEKLTQLIRHYPKQFQVIGFGSCIIFYFLLFNSSCLGIELYLLFIVNAIFLFFIVSSFSNVFENSKKEVIQKVSGLKKFSVLNSISYDNTDASKHSKERDISLLSFIVGFIIAYSTNASLITIFIEGKIGWAKDISPLMGDFLSLNPGYFKFEPQHTIGLLLTGFFLTFGSKFFHDLLDTLLQAKNLKKKLNDKETYRIESIEELDDYLKVTEGELVRLAIDENKDWLEKLPNFISVYVGAYSESGSQTKAAFLDITDEDISRIPGSIFVTLPSGNKKSVSLQVIPNCTPATVKYGKVSNKDTANYVGSLCCPLVDKSKKLYLLTCDHVLTDGDYLPETQTGKLSDHGMAKITINNQSFEGSWIYGYQDTEFDIALIEPATPASVVKSELSSNPLRIDHHVQGTPVSFVGAKSAGDGFIFATDVEYVVKYANESVRMTGLMKIAKSLKKSYGLISQPGDSGSILYTKDKKAVGMINASNDKFTFAIPLDQILNGWNLKIY